MLPKYANNTEHLRVMLTRKEREIEQLKKEIEQLKAQLEASQT